MSDEAKVDTTSAAYNVMDKARELPRALLGGTPAMRAEDEKFLPREPKESIESYNVRLSRSFLYGAFAETVAGIVAKPFSRPVVLKGDESLDERLAAIEGNADRAGTDLTQFARTLFWDAVVNGLSFILVDFPHVPGGTDGRQRLDARFRPAFIHIPADSLIAWRAEESPEGGIVLTMIRFHETQTEPFGEWGEEEVEYIHVYTRTTYEKFRKGPDDKEFYPVFEEPEPNTLGRVPLIPYYVNQTGFMTGLPPLSELAYMNLCHYQSFSDQRWILRFARVPRIFAAGVDDDDVDRIRKHGANQIAYSENPQASMMVVEHSGAAIAAGQTDLEALEERMVVLGLKPYTQRSGGVTATARAMDQAQTHTDIQAWIRGEENALLEAYRMAGEWIKITALPDDFGVDINNDFGITARVTEDINALLKARQLGEITRETFLRELKRRGVLADDVDVAEEAGAAASQPTLVRFPGPDEGAEGAA